MKACMLALAIALAPVAAAEPARVVSITARRFEFSPATVELRVGEPVVLELRSLDRKHGFAVPELGIDVEVVRGKPTRVRLVPDRPGTFSFHCSVFCGADHEDMIGRIVVSP